MPKFESTREEDIKKEIRISLATNPLSSTLRIQRDLFSKGFRSNSEGFLDNEYIHKLIRKINREAAHKIENSQIEGRMIETRARFAAMFDRLFKIAFWQWDYMEEGIMMPAPKDQIKAMEVLMKMDIALLEAEMDAGIFKRNLGTLGIEARNAPIKEENKKRILLALQNWFPIPSPNSLPENATAQPTNQ